MSDYKGEILSFTDGFAGQFPGYTCEHSPGMDFNHNCQGFIVFESSKRIGCILLTEELLDDVTVTEILVRLARGRLLDFLKKDKPIMFVNAGFSR